MITTTRRTRMTQLMLMMLFLLAQTVILLVLVVPVEVVVVQGYEATWESLDTRPLPSWYDDAKVGIFVHWGVFSVPSFKSEWFWYYWEGTNHHQRSGNEFARFVQQTEKPGFAYADYAQRFDAALWDPDYWADVFARSGAQYVVLTSKHHEGFCNWDSAPTVGTTWNWNSVQVGPRRDLVGDLAAAIRKPSVVSRQTKKPLKFGLYHSLYEWFNPLFIFDKQHNLTTQSFVDFKTMPELYHLVETYRPEVIWSDGDWEASSDYWKAKEFLAWLATNSSVKDTVVWNDRWGKDATCKHGSYITCSDRYVPKNISQTKYENCMTLDRGSWGFNRKANIEDYFTTKELVDEVVKTVARNGNILINVGPAADGTISPIMTDRLLGLGDWLAVNGQAIYKTRYWSVCDQDLNFDVFYTRDDDLLYLHLTQWPSDNQVPLVCPQTSEATRAYILGIGPDQHDQKVKLSKNGGGGTNFSNDTTTPDLHDHARGNRQRAFQPSVTLELPNLNPGQVPCQHVWVIVLTAVRNLDDDEELQYS